MRESENQRRSARRTCTCGPESDDSRAPVCIATSRVAPPATRWPTVHLRHMPHQGGEKCESPRTGPAARAALAHAVLSRTTAVRRFASPHLGLFPDKLCELPPVPEGLLDGDPEVGLWPLPPCSAARVVTRSHECAAMGSFGPSGAHGESTSLVWRGTRRFRFGAYACVRALACVCGCACACVSACACANLCTRACACLWLWLCTRACPCLCLWLCARAV